MTGLRAWLARRPGFPVVAIGVGYVLFGLAHAWGQGIRYPIDWVVLGLYELLSLAIVYAGLRLTDQRRSLADAARVVLASIGFGLIGAVVAVALVGLQLRRGVPLEAVGFLIVAASATTAVIGVALALYYIDLRAERSRIAEQAETVSELNKRLTVLNRVLRHNLRNELTVVQGHLEMLLDREPADEVAASLRTILAHARKMESLSENTYRLRQVWSEETRVEMEVTEVVESSVRELESAHPEVTISTDLPAHAVVRAHPRLKFAVDEALENAVVHNDALEVDVVVDVSRIRDVDEPTVAVSIADTGSGIPEFEPAVLEQASETPLEHATGLGLWLIYWIVEQSGGGLRIEGNEPRGTIVHMRLPAAGA